MADDTNIVRRKWRTATRQPLSVIAMIPLAWVSIGLSSLAILILPFRRLAPLLGRNLGATSLVPVLDARQQRRAQRIGQAITIAAKYAPFRSNCLPQAMAAAAFCRIARVPYAAHLGASLSDPAKPGQLSAHAWVQSGPVMVTGGAGSFQLFAAVACFVPGPTHEAATRHVAAVPRG